MGCTRQRGGLAVLLVASGSSACAGDDRDVDDALSGGLASVSVSVDGGVLDGGADGSSDGQSDAADDSDDGVDDDSGDATDDAASGTDGGTTGGVPFDHGLCGEPAPANAPQPPTPPSYSGGNCPMLQAGYNTGFEAGGRNREFALLLPSDVDDTGTYPLVFAWYHINGNAMEFVNDVQAQSLADDSRAIFVVPQDSGMFETVWPDTPLDIDQSDVDLAMFDDLYACIDEQFPINRNCVVSFGVSAGGLWTSYFGTKRGQYLASNITVSGGHPDEIIGQPWWPWQSKRKFATVVMWGGPSDVLGIDFNAASHNLLDDYTGSDHFVLRCQHDNGHGFPPAGDGDPFQMALHFGRNHPFWLNGESPLDMGLPAFYPSYCEAL